MSMAKRNGNVTGREGPGPARPGACFRGLRLRLLHFALLWSIFSMSLTRQNVDSVGGNH